MLVSGRSVTDGDKNHFFPTHITLVSHEDTWAWACSYRYLKEKLGVHPKFRMGDGAADLTKAGIQVTKK